MCDSQMLQMHKLKKYTLCLYASSKTSYLNQLLQNLLNMLISSFRNLSLQRQPPFMNTSSPSASSYCSSGRYYII